MDSKHADQCSTPLVRELQIKTIMRHPTPTRTAVIYNMGNEKCRQGRGDSGALVFCWWEREMVQPPWETV